MREFYLRPGTKYAGIHNVYEGYEEFRKHEPVAKLHKWARDDVRQAQIGDWVEAEDGLIVQLLQKYQVPKNPEPDRPVVTAFRFPMGTFGARQRKDGTTKYPQFYAQFVKADKGTMANSSRSTRSRDYNKVKFAALISAGMDARKAIRIAFPECRGFLTQHQIETKILRLLMDEVVRGELSEHAKEFKDEAQKLIPLERLLDEIKEYFDNVKKGTAEHKKAIEFGMEMHDVLVKDESGKRRIAKKRINELPEAEQIEESAPLLGNDKDD